LGEFSDTARYPADGEHPASGSANIATNAVRVARRRIGRRSARSVGSIGTRQL